MEFKTTLKLLVVWFMVQICISSSSANLPIAKPGCPDRCLDVTIPYPFGIGEGCYQSSSFAVECDPSKPNRTGRITDITLEGQFRIMSTVGYVCYDPKGRLVDVSSPWITLEEPFVFNSSANKFIVIGCDSFVFLKGGSNSRRYNTGCLSTCEEKQDLQDGSCSGVGCCQTPIPAGSSLLNVTMGSFWNHTRVSSFNPCSYAFVVANDAFQFFADNLTNIDAVKTVPLVVDWVIAYQTCEEAQKNSSAYACKGNSECYQHKDALGYRCRCIEGYEGNPYLPSGCSDIDECGNPDKYCPKNSVCKNTVGSYECKCMPGYHDDGDKGCVADNKKDNLPIFIGVGLSIGAVFLLIFSFCFYNALTRRKEKRLREEFFRKNGGLILQQKLSTRQWVGTYTIKIFTHEELKKSTNDFEEQQIIGRGGFGIVFKGELADKRIVAIKKSKGVDENQVEQFINEIILLSQINSRYVVKLLGCCLETEVPLLVYDYIDNGTLFGHLHNKSKASKLYWNIRLRIASEIAGVLSYLHSVASPQIIHRDIKSANILLDHNYTTKVSDFGISRLVSSNDNQVSTMIQGTLGYLDPEYMQAGVLTEKSDVYSFGIVLIELITGKTALYSDKTKAEKFLSNEFLDALKQNHLVEFLDSTISFSENLEQLEEVAMIAQRCISVRGDDRPYMKDVKRELEALGAKAEQNSDEDAETSSKRESFHSIHSFGYENDDDDPISSGQYSIFYTTPEQPLITLSGGRRRV